MYMCTYAEIETKSVGNTYRYFLNFGIEYAKVKRGRNDKTCAKRSPFHHFVGSLFLFGFFLKIHFSQMTPQWNFDLNCRQKINNLEQYLCELLHAISHSHPSAANYLTETVKASLSSTTSLKVYSQLVNVNVSFLKSTYITI